MTGPADPASVIAVSGLGGHAFGSFKEKDSDHMWLRDALPFDLTNEATDQPMARVVTYGYNSTVSNSHSTQNLDDLATALQTSLRPLADGPSRRIVFVAHSLGGLIVKQVRRAAPCGSFVGLIVCRCSSS